MLYPGSVRHPQYLSAWKAAGVADQPKAQENQAAWSAEPLTIMLNPNTAFIRGNT